MRYGTCHFVSLPAAFRYYRPYGIGDREVRRKLSEGEIAVGPPECPDGCELIVNEEGRYVVQDLPTEGECAQN